MRVITGKYKGRRFDIPKTFKARPTTDFSKENIFNVINGYINLEDAEALDLFAGTGSISLELLSRGCSNVISIESDHDHASFIHNCMKKIGIENNILIRGDVFKFIKHCDHKFNIIFADPPYALANIKEIPNLVLNGNLLKDNGIFILEHGNNCSFSDNIYFIDHRTYGSVNFSIFRYIQQTKN
jgi:16S rRNA (guanine966-N2)-methyltransferase